MRIEEHQGNTGQESGGASSRSSGTKSTQWHAVSHPERDRQKESAIVQRDALADVWDDNRRIAVF